MNINISKTNLKLMQVIKFSLILFSIYIVYHMTFRSVWLDEATLLKSILNNKSFLDFLAPLPDYNQAEPFLVSIFFKFITSYISEDFQTIRVVISLLFVISMWPLLTIFKKNIFGQLLLILIIFSNLFSFAFYFTEIKHYFFEILATTFMVYSIYLYDKKNNLTPSVLIILGSMILGFSTLIPAIIILAYFLLQEYKKRETLFQKDILLMMGFSLFVIIATYVHMKLLTVYQISNYDIYTSKGFVGDLKQLLVAFIAAYSGKSFLILASIATIYALFVERTSLLFKLNTIFIVLILVITFAKVIELYPVASGRHLLWLLPFSIVIMTLAIQKSLSQDGLPKYLGYFLIMGLLVKSLITFHKAYDNKYPEFSANNALYTYVSNMNKSMIVVYPHAQPSLEYYSRLMPSLEKHTYYGLLDTKSQHSNIQGAKAFSTTLNNTFSIPNNEFYYIMSHSGQIDDMNNHHVRIELLRNKFKEAGCSYTSAFSDNRVQLLKISCNKKGDY